MDIKINLSKDFERTLEDLKKKYGEDFEYIEGVHPSQQDCSEFLSNFISNETLADATIDPNANANHKDIRSFITERGKSQDKLFALNKIFYEMKKKWGLRTAKQWLECEFNKAINTQDASTASYMPYCYAVDVEKLAREGLFFLNNYNNQPPKHLTTFLDDIIEFVSFLCNRQSGAVGLPSVLIWAFWFWKKDCEQGFFIKDKEYYLKQCFQKLIYRLNQPFLRLDQTAFTNMSVFDREYLVGLFGGLEFPDGTFAIDCIEEIIECQKVFMQTVSEIRREQMFTFPVLTASLKVDSNRHFVDEEFARWMSDHNVEWQDSNFFISEDVQTLSNCCRLLSSTNKLTAFTSSIGGTALSIGSCRVSTINLVRIAYESKCKESKYLEILKDRTLLDCKALYTMRHILKRNIDKGLLPNYQDGALELDKQYCTIGILGLYEVMDLFGYINQDELGYKSYTPEAMDFANKIFEVLNDVKDNFTDEFTFNIEQIPGETTASVLCKADNLLYEQDKYFMYANQWIPLMEKCTIQEKCRVSAILDNKCSGGAIAHINIEGKFPNNESAWDMLNYIAQEGVIYSAFNTKIGTCRHKHASIGMKTCPTCGEKITDTWSRIVGFYVPTSNFSAQRKKEFNLRTWYNLGLTEQR